MKNVKAIHAGPTNLFEILGNKEKTAEASKKIK